MTKVQAKALTPDRDCALCPRLVEFRAANRAKFPDQFNAPVPAFGGLDAELLIVGLAPGLKGANFSGRPFTGDYAGDLLYGTLLKFGFARGEFKARADDGLELVNCRITNAVKCVPPENKPTTQETQVCMDTYLTHELAAMTSLKVILSLGLISHNAVLKAFGLKQAQYKFAHEAVHRLPSGLTLIDSYHCSRYNTQTGRLTTKMFEDVFEEIQSFLTTDEHR
ncbi:MAG: uracil-DNA glycosylase [Bdellovibrionales bacterium]